MAGIIDLEVVPVGVCGVIVTTYQERYTEGGAFVVVDTLHHWYMRVVDLTFILDAEDFFEGEGPLWLKHGRSFFGL